jgi:hypothetical protein
MELGDINVGVLGPFVYAALEAVKRAGFPTRYMPLLSIIMAGAIAGVSVWGQWQPLAILTNAGVIYLAIEGSFKNGKRVVKVSGDSNIG